MARTYPFTEEKLERWLKDGRGTGEGDTWNPWLHRGDFNSIGKAGFGPTLAGGREVHLLSELERNAWRVYICKEAVLGIEEQTPLDREETRRIARSLGIPHPRSPESKVDIVMTTDLVIRVRAPTGQVIRIARSVKGVSKLGDHNQSEHAELERRYWHSQGVHFGILTPERFPRELLSNADTLYMHRDEHLQAEPLGYAGSFQHVAQEVLGEVLAAREHEGLYDFCTALNDNRGWPPGLATRVAIHHIRWHRLRADYVGSRFEHQSVLAIAEATRSHEMSVHAIERAA